VATDPRETLIAAGQLPVREVGSIWIVAANNASNFRDNVSGTLFQGNAVARAPFGPR
jgi:hypothetical protein